MSSQEPQVLLVDIAPGIGGAERATIPALASSKAFQTKVIGPEIVCSFAREAGLSAVYFDPPGIRLPVLGALRLVVGSYRLRRLSIREGADLLYGNSARGIAYAIGARLLGGPPLVVHHHEVGRRGGLVRAIERWAKVIIVPSRAAADPFRNSRNLQIVPTGVDLTKFRPTENRQTARQAMGLPDDGPVVGMLGRADPHKGMGPFIRVANEIGGVLPETTFLLAGGAMFPHEEIHYQRIIREAKTALGERAILPGRLIDPLPAYQAMDVMLHLGKAESLPTAVIEAAACGLPVVAYDWGGVREIIDPGVSGFLVPPEDEGAVVASVIEMITNKDLLERLRLSSRKVAEDRFDFASFAERLERVVMLAL